MGSTQGYYLTTVSIITKDITMLVTSSQIFINGIAHQWLRSGGPVTHGQVTVTFSKYKVSMSMKGHILLVMLRHLHNDTTNYKIDHVGLYIKNKNNFSNHSKGLLGKYHVILSKHCVYKIIVNIVIIQVKLKLPSLFAAKRF